MQKRNPLAIVGLSIITFGIYDIYWLYVTKKELNEKTSHHIPSIWLLFVGPVLLIVSYIILFAGSAKTTNTFAYGSATSTSSHTSGSLFIGLILVVISWIITVVISIVWLFKFSKAVDEYTKGKMSTAMTFLILYLVHLIGVALIQDTFNGMLDNPAPVGNAMPPVGPTPAFAQPEMQQPLQPTVPQQPIEPQAPVQSLETPVPSTPTAQSDQTDSSITPQTPEPPVQPSV